MESWSKNIVEDPRCNKNPSGSNMPRTQQTRTVSMLLLAIAHQQLRKFNIVDAMGQTRRGSVELVQLAGGRGWNASGDPTVVGDRRVADRGLIEHGKAHQHGRVRKAIFDAHRVHTGARRREQNVPLGRDAGVVAAAHDTSTRIAMERAQGNQ